MGHGLVEAVDRLGQSVVIAVVDAADGMFDPAFGEALGVADRNVLAAALAVKDEAAALRRPPVVERLLERIEDDPKGGEANLA